MFLFKRTAAFTYTGVQSVGQFASRWLSLQLDADSRIKSVEGVRGTACLTVIWFHLNEIARNVHIWNLFQTNIVYNAIALGGSAGVTLFFVLSGFLLFMPYVKATLFEFEWPSTWRFYLRRVLRIIPAYYFSLGLLILLTHPEYLQPNHLPDLGLFLTLLMNTPSTFMKINGPYWTLAIEWQFYLILPWLALGIGLIVRRIGSSPQRKAWIVAALLLGVITWGVSSRYWGPYLLQHPTQTFLIPRPALNVIHPVAFDYNIVSEFVMASGFGLCLTAILFGTFSLRRVFEWNPLRFMGMISYSLYIWHLPLLNFFMNNVGPQMAAWNPFAAYSLYLLWILLVIIPFTFLCYKFVEKPWMDLSAQWTKKRRKTPCLTSAVSDPAIAAATRRRTARACIPRSSCMRRILP
jgi:peptidoglycan/LPS O-acetylase OafA/YrhL